jgi:hypothetical protein
MVMERFKSSACTEAEVCAWLSEQVRQRKLKLLWTDTDPECMGGLHLTGEGLFAIPRLRPDARTIDELDWSAGELRRRVRYPKPVEHDCGNNDPFKLTPDQLLARYGFRTTDSSDKSEPEDWVITELAYWFTIKRASLVAILDRVAVPLGTVRVALSEAAEVIARRFTVSPQMGLQAIVETAAANGSKFTASRRPSCWDRETELDRWSGGKLRGAKPRCPPTRRRCPPVRSLANPPPAPTPMSFVPIWSDWCVNSPATILLRNPEPERQSRRRALLQAKPSRHAIAREWAMTGGARSHAIQWRCVARQNSGSRLISTRASIRIATPRLRRCVKRIVG